MIWLTWRQFRPQAITAVIVLAVIAIVLAATGPGVASAYASSGLPACHASCATDASNFFIGLNRLDVLLYFASFLLMYLAPALMGIFWGAPLIAREVEAGTHRIAWNQTITSTRWTLVKLGLVGLAAVATAGLLSLMVTWWATPINHAALSFHGTTGFVPQMDPAAFAARGVAPLGYAAFAFAVGVAAGVLLRRTLPAMAVTLVAFAVIQVLVPNLVRPHLLPPAHFTVPLNFSGVGVSMNASTGQVSIQLAGPLAKPGAWVLSDVITTSSGAQLPNVIITPSGAELTVPPKGCALTPGTGGFGGCKDVLAAMHLRESVSYQPASRFWPLQWTETGIYLVLAAGLGWLCVSQVRRRRLP